MRLLTAQIQKFKCIKDSNEFTLDPKVTCLVGKNELGKTAILQALNKLNSSNEDKSKVDFDDLDYPRHMWPRKEDEETLDKVLVTKWELSSEDLTTLEDICQGRWRRHHNQRI